MSGDCRTSFEQVVDYALGEVAGDAAEAFEEHLFDCARCGRRLDLVDLLRRSVADAVLAGAVGVVVNAGFLARAAGDGLTWRDYRIEEGASVACSAGPEDLVVVRLATGAAGELRVEGTFTDLERGATAELPTRQVLVDRDLGEVLMVFPGEAVRAYPRSRWTLHLRGEGDGGAFESGPYVMDHTP